MSVMQRRKGCPVRTLAWRRGAKKNGEDASLFGKKRNFEKSLKTGTALIMGVERVDRRLLGPVLAGFFIMGFCDMVAPITGRIAAEFPAERQAAVSFLPTMVFLWFLVLSAPFAAWMNRRGRKTTALAGYLLTVVGLLVPYAAGEGCALGWYFAGFGLLGIGNTAIQVAVNPLLATIVPAERMTSYLTVGQIFRNTSLLLLAPIVTGLVAATGSWRLLLPIYAALTVAGGGVAATGLRARAAAQRNLRRTGSLLRSAEEPCGAALGAGRGMLHRRRRGDRLPLGAADRQPLVDPHDHGFLRLPHRRDDRRGVGPSCGSGTRSIWAGTWPGCWRSASCCSSRTAGR